MRVIQRILYVNAFKLFIVNNVIHCYVNRLNIYGGGLVLFMYNNQVRYRVVGGCEILAREILTQIVSRGSKLIFPEQLQEEGAWGRGLSGNGVMTKKMRIIVKTRGKELKVNDGLK